MNSSNSGKDNANRSFFAQLLTKRHKLTKCIVALAGFGTILLGVGAHVAPLLHGTDIGELPHRADPITVATVAVEFADTINITRCYTGQIVARRRSTLGFERAGLVEEVSVDEGLRVSKGDQLARLDTDSLKIQIKQLNAQLAAAQALMSEMRAGPRPETIAAARAQVAEQEARLAFWQRESDRLNRLQSKGAAGDKEARDAATELAATGARLEAIRESLNELLAGTRQEQLDAQQAAVDQLKATIEQTELELRKCHLIAPFAGSISHRYIDEGSVVAAGTGIVELVEDGILEARVGMPVETASRLQIGDRHPIRVGSRVCQSQVAAVLPQLDPATRTVTVVFSVIDENQHGLAPGRIVRLELPEPIESSGFWIPTGALVKAEHGLWAVYALTNATSDSTDRNKVTAKLERREIEALHTQADRVFVRGLLQDGERIVAAGAHRVVPGQWVRADSIAPQLPNKQLTGLR